MKLPEKFNQLTCKEYRYYIENHASYIDFNTLGLYRSIVENEKLSLEEKIVVRELANEHFKKSFDFLQLKDPQTFFQVSTLGQELTIADERQFWKGVIANQQKILKDKKIKHRSFGIYSKHTCGYENCPYNGLMVKAGDFLKYSNMHFDSDKSGYGAKEKSKRLKQKSRQSKVNLQNLSDED